MFQAHLRVIFKKIQYLSQQGLHDVRAVKAIKKTNLKTDLKGKIKIPVNHQKVPSITGKSSS